MRWSRRGRHAATRELVDAAVMVTAAIDLRDGVIEGLRDAVAERDGQLSAARCHAADLEATIARLQAAHSRCVLTGLTQQWMTNELARRQQHASEPTEVTSTAQLRAAHSVETERWNR